MIHKKIKILSWNCRGLGDLEKCRVVSDVIRNSRCDVVLLQETKLNEVNLRYVLSFLPSFFNSNCAFNQASHSKGGLIIAWKRAFDLQMCYSTPHTLTVSLRNCKEDREILITNVYGPAVESEKARFIDELIYVRDQVNLPWILAGDFNLVRWMVDRSGIMREFELMDLFNDFIRQSGLVDVPLSNRLFTWSNKRPQPSFSKIDRVLISGEWNIDFPVITLEAKEMVVSDHTPLLLTCKNTVPQPKNFRLETFWFKYEIPRVLVQRLWEGKEVRGPPTNLM